MLGRLTFTPSMAGRSDPPHADPGRRRVAFLAAPALILASVLVFLGCASSESNNATSHAAAIDVNASSSVRASTSTSALAHTQTSGSARASLPGHRRPLRAHVSAVAVAGSDGRALVGEIVGIDPGHNGGNFSDPAYIGHPIWNGREWEECDTTGTETDGGYTEARFNFNVARYLAADLRREDATVVLTRTSNTGVGPCVNRRSEIINRAHADVAVDIHADGGPPGGRGFTILEPLPDGPNDRVIAPSDRFGHDLRERFRDITGMPLSTYDGSDGISLRDNLAGLNLTTVPKVLIECGNMRNSTDASLLVRSSFQRLAARAIAAAITEYLG